MSEQQTVQQVEKKENQSEQQTEQKSKRGQNLSEYKTIRVKKDLYDKVKSYIDSLKNQSEQEKPIDDQLKVQTEQQKKKSDNSWIALLVIGLLGLFLLLSPYILPKLGINIQKGESNE